MTPVAEVGEKSGIGFRSYLHFSQKGVSNYMLISLTFLYLQENK